VGELEPLPPDLRRAEVAVNLHGRGPQSHQLLLASRPRKLLCFENPQVPASRGSPHWRPGEHEVSRWCRMLAENGIPADPTRLRVRPPAGGASEAVAGAVVTHPGAARAARRWPPQRFAAVARAQVRQGRPVVITGSAAELPLARSVAGLAKLPEGSVLAGKTDLKGLAQVVATARAVICGDTGVGHLATALGTPSVLLFGPTPPCEWGPPAAARRHRVLWAGQVGDPHGEQPSPGLMGLTVDRVLRALETVMVAA
jgi:ADP-heptose:LPS heptosyltransferase